MPINYTFPAEGRLYRSSRTKKEIAKVLHIDIVGSKLYIIRVEEQDLTPLPPKAMSIKDFMGLYPELLHE